tara:strand:+ start:303 stop:881 length:579 start_codon:yes stop_codon:yes gene_type:complete
MKKSHSKYLYVLLFAILSAPVFGDSGEGDENPNQNNSKPGYNFLHSRNDGSENFNNQLTLDVQFLGIGVGYKKRVYKDFFVGVDAGAGFGINYSFDAPANRRSGAGFSEIFYLTPNISYKPNSNWQMLFGITRAQISLDEEKGQINTAVRFGFFAGDKKLQYGFQLSMGKDETNDFFFYTSLIILKFRVKNW